MFLAAIIYSLLYHFKFFCRFFKKMPYQKLFLWSLFLFVISFVLREFLIPHIYHVYYDAFYYQEIAKNIYYNHSFSRILMGSHFHLNLLANSHRPGGYPFLLAFIFRVFGISENVAFLVNVIMGSFSVVFVFWIAYLFFRKIDVSIWSAVVFLFLPVHLRYSTSASSDIFALCFILAGGLLLLVYLDTRKKSLFYLVGLLIVFSSYIRPENILLYLILPGLLIHEYKKGYFSANDVRDYAFFIFMFIAPLIIQIPKLVAQECSNANVYFLSFGHLVNNLLSNFEYLFDFRYHSLASTIFFLLGVVYLFTKNKKLFFPSLILFFVFFFGK